jgi:hypothetical protein
MIGDMSIAGFEGRADGAERIRVFEVFGQDRIANAGPTLLGWSRQQLERAVRIHLPMLTQVAGFGLNYNNGVGTIRYESVEEVAVLRGRESVRRFSRRRLGSAL